MPIPRRIIQTWRSNDIPPYYYDYQSRLKQMNPEYELMFFTDEDIIKFVRQEYPEFYETFDKFPNWICRIDLFRLLAVYKFGGFWLDLDVMLTKSLDLLRNNSCVFPFERQADPYFCMKYRHMESLGQFAFGAESDNQFIFTCAENIKRAVLDQTWINFPPESATVCFLPLFDNNQNIRIFYTSGPALITRTYVENIEFQKSVNVIYAYDQSASKYLWWCFGTYGVHAMHGTWKQQNGFSGNRLQQQEISVKQSMMRLSRCVDVSTLP